MDFAQNIKRTYTAHIEYTKCNNMYGTSHMLVLFGRPFVVLISLELGYFFFLQLDKLSYYYRAHCA